MMGKHRLNSRFPFFLYIRALILLFHNFTIMILNTLFKGLLFLLLCVASTNLSSCHKDSDGDNNQGGTTDPADCRPGDDFYTYVNAEWLKSLEGTDSEGWRGYFYDIARANTEKVQAIRATMPEMNALQQSGANRDKNLAASVQLAEEIVKSLLEVETREDVYVAFGKAIRLGVPSIASLHTAICHEDNTIGFYFTPPVPEEDEEDMTDPQSAAEMAHHVTSKRLSRYVPSTRSGKTAIDYILEGIGLDPNYYLYNELSTEMVATLEELDTKDLLKNIGEATLTELLCYCSDEYVNECTGGTLKSVEEYINKSLQRDLGYFISYYFSQAYPTDSVEPVFSALGNELVETFRKRLEDNEWLSPATQLAAIEKLDCMKKYYGTPKKWPVTDLQLEGEMLLADMLDVKESRYNIIESLLGKSMTEYLPIYYMFFNPLELIYSYTPNAFYDAAFNVFYVLPPFMMEPAYTADMDECKFYATWGMMIGHEITHGFDQLGATYDKNGEQNNWWTESDADKFAELNALRVANVSTHELLPGMNVNGEQTVREDVADLGGFNIAYDMWVNKLKERGVKGDELKEQKRQFFLHFAKGYGEKLSDEDMIKRAEKDVHSAGHIRINSVVQHIDDWYELFNVVEGDALYLAPEDRITIW